MLPVTFNKKLHLIMPALICVLAIGLITKVTLPHFVGEYFSGIIFVYTYYPFFIFSFAGDLVYLALFFTALYKIGDRARSGSAGQYISGYIIFIVSLDLIIFRLSGDSGLTAISVILQDPINQVSYIPLIFLAYGCLGIAIKSPAMKSTSAIFGTAFIISNTLLFN